MRFQNFVSLYLEEFVCRDCLNAATGLKFRPEDCHHDAYPRKCPNCGDTRYLIRGLHRSGRRKLIFFRPKKTQKEPTR